MGVVILREHVRSQLPWAAIGGPIKQSSLYFWGHQGQKVGEIEVQFPMMHENIVPP